MRILIRLTAFAVWQKEAKYSMISRKEEERDKMQRGKVTEFGSYLGMKKESVEYLLNFQLS